MMNLNKYYLYATGGYKGEVIYRHSILQIIEDHEIKTKEILDYVGKSYNRSDEICLCDVTLNQDKKGKIEYASAFENFVLKGSSLVLSRNLEVYQPQLLQTTKVKYPATDMYDEVRHIQDISLDGLEFITYPIYKGTDAYKYKFEIQKLEYFYKELVVIKRKYSHILVKDIYTEENITPKDVKLFIKDCKRNKKSL